MPSELNLSFSPLPEDMLCSVVKCENRLIGEKALKLIEVFAPIVQSLEFTKILEM